jgi:hypothetical protein
MKLRIMMRFILRRRFSDDVGGNMASLAIFKGNKHIRKGHFILT